MNSLNDEIKNKLSDATEEQINRFSAQVLRLNKTIAFFKKYPEELEQFDSSLKRAEKALDYSKPYRIAVIGTTGAGKSTLINALLGRSLVLTKAIGKPATGTALEIFLDIPLGGLEKATVIYRNPQDIGKLIEDFVKRYDLNDSSLKGKRGLDNNFAILFSQLEPQRELSDRQKKEFLELRHTLTDIINQYANNISRTLQTEFDLNHSRDRQYLMELIDENSSLNSENSTSRLIGLVKTVSYHIQPESSPITLPSLQLPGNVCLVDLPGLDGTALHDIIISEGIKDADAVIFILSPPRILGRGDSYLLDRVRQYISTENSIESGERIFLVLNAKDSIMTDNTGILNNLPRDMQDLMNLLIPGYETYPLLAKRGGDTPYFLTSAWAACAAQKSLKGIDLEAETNTYEATKVKLQVQGKDDHAVLEASQIPRLVQEIGRFTRERRIEGQINDGKQFLDFIIDGLDKKFNRHSSLPSQGENFQEQIEKILNNKQSTLKNIVYDFQQVQISQLSELRQRLKQEALNICDITDSELSKRIPYFWKDYFHSKPSVLTGERRGKVLYEAFLDEIQIELWKRLNLNLPNLSSYLVINCKRSLESLKIAEKIADSSYEYLISAKIKSGLESFIVENTSSTMDGIASRIGVTVLARSDLFFTAMDKQEIKQKQLFQSLEKIPYKENINASEFTPVIEEIRKIYERYIVEDCVNLILNLYFYEIISIRNYLCCVIEDMFRDFRNDKNPAFLEKIRESLNMDEEWKQRMILEEKMKYILQLKQ